jgi:hypothetical protein
LIDTIPSLKLGKAEWTCTFVARVFDLFAQTLDAMKGIKISNLNHYLLIMQRSLDNFRPESIGYQEKVDFDYLFSSKLDAIERNYASLFVEIFCNSVIL